MGANPIGPIGRSAGSNQSDKGPDSEYQNSSTRETGHQRTDLDSIAADLNLSLRVSPAEGAVVDTYIYGAQSPSLKARK